MPRASGTPLMPAGVLKPIEKSFYNVVNMGKAYLIVEVMIARKYLLNE